MTHHPIGYWLRKADEALTARIDEVQQGNGLARLEWQVLNAFHELGTGSVRDIAEAVGPFADTSALVEGVERLVQRDVIEAAAIGSPEYRLTESGRRLHASALEAQKGLRQRAMEGVSQEDYTTAVRVLQRIVENLQE